MARLLDLSAVKPGSTRTIGFKTKLYRYLANPSCFDMRLYNTKVVSYDGDFLFVSNGGWCTNMTSERIHKGLRYLGCGLWLCTTDLPGKWRVMDRRGNAWTIRGTSLTLRRVSPKPGTSDPSWARVA